MAQIEVEGHGQPGGAASELPIRVHGSGHKPARPCHGSPLDDLTRAEKHGSSGARRAAHHVHTVVEAEMAIDVQMARRAEHRPIAVGAPAVGMRARILRAVVGLNLGDADGDVTLGRTSSHVGAKQTPSDVEDGPVIPAPIWDR